MGSDTRVDGAGFWTLATNLIWRPSRTPASHQDDRRISFRFGGASRLRLGAARRNQNHEQASPIGKGAGIVLQSGFHIRSEEHTSELQSLMRISYAVFCLKKKKITLCI